MMQKVQIWRNDKYFRFNILIKCTTFLKSRALILTPFLIRTSHLSSTMAQVVSRWLSPRRPSFNPQQVFRNFLLKNMFKIAHPRRFGGTFCLFQSCTVLLNTGTYIIICTASHVTRICFRCIQRITSYLKRNKDKSFTAVNV
jgi:hypothetical protein